MLFRKKMDPACGYCRHSRPAEEGTVICLRRGIMRSWEKCAAFSYDPLRRTPEQPLPPKTDDLDPDEFLL